MASLCQSSTTHVVLMARPLNAHFTYSSPVSSARRRVRQAHMEPTGHSPTSLPTRSCASSTVRSLQQHINDRISSREGQWHGGGGSRPPRGVCRGAVCLPRRAGHDVRKCVALMYQVYLGRGGGTWSSREPGKPVLSLTIKRMDQRVLERMDLHLVAPRNSGVGAPSAANTYGEGREQTMNGSCHIHCLV